MKKPNILSILITDEHKQMLQLSRALNDCEFDKVIEDCLNKYYGLNNEIER